MCTKIFESIDLIHLVLCNNIGLEDFEGHLMIITGVKGIQVNFFMREQPIFLLNPTAINKKLV